MATDPKRKPDDPEQSKRFIEAAREIEADETEAGAKKALEKVILVRPSKQSPSQS